MAAATVALGFLLDRVVSSSRDGEGVGLAALDVSGWRASSCEVVATLELPGSALVSAAATVPGSASVPMVKNYFAAIASIMEQLEPVGKQQQAWREAMGDLASIGDARCPGAGELSCRVVPNPSDRDSR